MEVIKAKLKMLLVPMLVVVLAALLSIQGNFNEFEASDKRNRELPDSMRKPEGIKKIEGLFTLEREQEKEEIEEKVMIEEETDSVTIANRRYTLLGIITESGTPVAILRVGQEVIKRVTVQDSLPDIDAIAEISDRSVTLVSDKRTYKLELKVLR